MTADPLRLLDWKIPVTKHRYTRRDTALHALSLGAGSDPLDVTQHQLVDPWCPELQALPTLALVIGYPGFWLGEPKVEEVTGVAPWQVLHSAQAVALSKPLPAEGAVVSHTRVTGLTDRGPARGSLLHSERRIYDEAGGSELAVCTQVHVLRSIEGFGSSPGAPRQDAMDDMWMPTRSIDVPTMPQQALLYRLNGDSNALHIAPQRARQAGFERPILHGMCTTGMAVTALVGALAAWDAAKVRGFQVQMSNPVYPGETLRIEFLPDGRFRTLALGRDKVVLRNGNLDMFDWSRRAADVEREHAERARHQT